MRSQVVRLDKGNMPRYVIQPHETTCAPTAIINAGKWAGKNLTIRRDYTRIVLESRSSEEGTSYGNIDRVLRDNLSDYLIVKKPRNPWHFSVREHIKKGGAALISYSYDTQDCSFHRDK